MYIEEANTLVDIEHEAVDVKNMTSYQQGKVLPSQSIDSDCLKTGNKERGFPSDLPPVQRKMVAYGYRTIVSMCSCWKYEKPFISIGPHVLTQDGPNQLFFHTK